MTYSVAFWPDYSEFNPYQALFYAALAPLGVTAVPGVDFSVRGWPSTRQVDAIHIHWPEGVWRRAGSTGWKTPALLYRLSRFLSSANHRGIKVIWTAHNLGHHEGTSGFDRVGYRILMRHADLVIVHSRHAAEALRRGSPGGEKIMVMPHGNYEMSLPKPHGREEVLAALGMNPAIPVMAVLGNIRTYKGIEVAVEAARRLQGRIQLIVAGQVHESFNSSALLSAAAADPYFRFMPRALSEQEYSDIVAASECVVLPYRAVTSSGVLLSAWSLERCVIASDLEFFVEYGQQNPGGLRLFRNGDAADLADAIERFLAEPVDDRQEGVRRAKRQSSWHIAIRPVEEIFEQWILEKRLTARSVAF
jgi:beta-1,4-mannosyltransferase